MGNNLLLVDDEPVYGEILAGLLDPLGLTIVCCTDTLEAFQRVRADRFSAILMDMQMAGIDGARGSRHLRQVADWTRTVPIIAFTALRPATGERYFLERDLDGWLPKPFDSQMVLSTLSRWLTLAPDRRVERARNFISIVGDKRAVELERRLVENLAGAIALVEAGADPAPLGHRLGALAGTMGHDVIASAWLALSHGRGGGWPTVKTLTLEWLAGR